MTGKAGRIALRAVLVVQLAIIAIFVALARGWLPDPDSGRRMDEPSDWILIPVGAALAFTIYTFPLWGAVVAWRSDMPRWKVRLVLLVELGLWLTLFIAMWPSVT